jgi:hypothetical protein
MIYFVERRLSEGERGQRGRGDRGNRDSGLDPPGFPYREPSVNPGGAASKPANMMIDEPPNQTLDVGFPPLITPENRESFLPDIGPANRSQCWFISS